MNTRMVMSALLLMLVGSVCAGQTVKDLAAESDGYEALQGEMEELRVESRNDRETCQFLKGTIDQRTMAAGNMLMLLCLLDTVDDETEMTRFRSVIGARMQADMDQSEGFLTWCEAVKDTLENPDLVLRVDRCKAYITETKKLYGGSKTQLEDSRTECDWMGDG